MAGAAAHVLSFAQPCRQVIGEVMLSLLRPGPARGLYVLPAGWLLDSAVGVVAQAMAAHRTHQPQLWP
ncbi:hypothetical protein [Amycolatopsis sp. PS_44_ISF1]|uniref:hypothetical protein n=1 Tax=Amycolatopsis sp. PS_44_ISF1 TaxID=2974917 RepID=UPI0028E006E5|nr:hypothetical protein [Amycolatopsis sp. PS_44_ISF1]MDT8914658.1 hypothetical protein [Amycolatopsis sp. PS_44_ISF1]